MRAPYPKPNLNLPVKIPPPLLSPFSHSTPSGARFISSRRGDNLFSRIARPPPIYRYGNYDTRMNILRGVFIRGEQVVPAKCPSLGLWPSMSAGPHMLEVATFNGAVTWWHVGCFPLFSFFFTTRTFVKRYSYTIQ